MREVPHAVNKPNAPPTRLEIARELAVCPTCHRCLQGGTPLAVLLRQRGQERPRPGPQLQGWVPLPKEQPRPIVRTPRVVQEAAARVAEASRAIWDKVVNSPPALAVDADDDTSALGLGTEDDDV